MTPNLEKIIQAFQHLHSLHVKGEQDCTEEILNLIQAASIIGSSLDKEHCHKAARAIGDVVLRDLEEEVNTRHGGPQEDVLVVYVDFASEFFRYFADKEAATKVFEGMWPVLSQALNVCSGENATERTCRALKYAVRISRERCESILIQMLKQIDYLFSERLHSGLLYLAAEVLKVFATRSDWHDSLLAFLFSLLNSASSQLSTLEDFNQKPYIADDLFLLLIKLLDTNAAMLYSEQMLQPLVDLSLKGMFVEHLEASQSILRFMRALLRTRQPHELKMLENVIVPRGQWLATSLVLGIAGCVPRARLDELAEVIHALMNIASTSATQWMLANISAIPPSVATEGVHWNLLLLLASFHLSVQAKGKLCTFHHLCY